MVVFPHLQTISAIDGVDGRPLKALKEGRKAFVDAQNAREHSYSCWKPVSTCHLTLLNWSIMFGLLGHMWHLKLPLNMEETSPNPLIQALL